MNNRTMIDYESHQSRTQIVGRKSSGAIRALSATLAISLMLATVLPASANRAEDPEKYYRSPSSIHGKTVMIPTGSHIEGRLNNTISSKSRRGEKFSIEITSPVMANSTDVVIPSGSKIIGEVVEAIPSSKQKKQPGARKKPLGKLRTQLNTIQTPDGVSHPLMASIAGEFQSLGRGRVLPNDDIDNPNLGYVGTQASFNAVHPGLDKRANYKRGPKTVTRRDFFRDPILGVDSMGKRRLKGTPIIKSVSKKGRDIYIYEGSPVTVKLDAPLKLGIAPSKGRLSIDVGSTAPRMYDEGPGGNFRRFAPEPTGGPPPEEPQQRAGGLQGGRPGLSQNDPEPEAPPEPDSDLPNFLRKSRSERFRESFSAAPERQNQGSQDGQGPQSQGGVPGGSAPSDF